MTRFNNRWSIIYVELTNLWFLCFRYINVYPTDALEVDHKMSVPEFTMSPPHAVFVHSRKSDLGKLYIEKVFVVKHLGYG